MRWRSAAPVGNYNETRTHLALDKDAPLSRTVKRAGVFFAGVLGGLHHENVRTCRRGKPRPCVKLSPSLLPPADPMRPWKQGAVPVSKGVRHNMSPDRRCNAKSLNLNAA